jgi:hypothetical protein
MKIILSVVYVSLAILAGAIGLIIPSDRIWSEWACGACGVFWLFSMGLAFFPVALPARSAGWCLHGISVFVVGGLLAAYAHTSDSGWLLGCIAVALINLVVTFIIGLVLRPGVER